MEQGRTGNGMSGHEPERDLRMADERGAHGGMAMQIDIVAKGRVHLPQDDMHRSVPRCHGVGRGPLPCG